MKNFINKLVILINITLFGTSFAFSQEPGMIVYKTHEKNSSFGNNLANSNAADALGSIKFLVENPMGLNMQEQEITAFKVRWHGVRADFSGTYKECNRGNCIESALENNTNTKRGKAFGTLHLAGGGKWFSFEEADQCSTRGGKERECFTYELIGTFSNTLMPIIALGYGTAAAYELQQSFPMIAELLEEGWIDHTHYQPCSLQQQMERFLKNNSFRGRDDGRAEDGEWD